MKMPDVELHHKEAFRRLLTDYHIAPESAERLRKVRMVILNSVAGGGRNSVINHLLSTNLYYFIVSDTTRPPKSRDGKMEQNGVIYFFRDENEMLQDIKDGKFLEAELIHDQQVSGISMRELMKAARLHKIAITDMEYGGAGNIASVYPSATIIGLLPPNYDEWMRRLHARETMTPEEFHNRLTTARKVLENMLEKTYFRLVINNSLDQAAADVRQIVEDMVVDPDKQSYGRKVALDTLERVKKTLTELSTH